MATVNVNYFKHKNNAGTVCKVGKYLKENNITDGDLEKDNVLTSIKQLIPTDVTPAQLTKTIRAINIDVLKTKPWHINSGVLFIAGVEYVLFPNYDYSQEDGTLSRMFIFEDVYGGNDQMINKAFKTLFIGSPQLNNNQLKLVKPFFKIKKHTDEDNENLEPIRDYLNNIEISEEEEEYIKAELRIKCPIRPGNRN